MINAKSVLTLRFKELSKVDIQRHNTTHTKLENQNSQWGICGYYINIYIRSHVSALINYWSIDFIKIWNRFFQNYREVLQFQNYREGVAVIYLLKKFKIYIRLGTYDYAEYLKLSIGICDLVYNYTTIMILLLRR